jgi:hypothetical protein
VSELLVLEHKSTSEDIALGGSFIRRLNIDVQTDTYLDLARSIGHDPAGVLYDLLRKPAQRPSAKGETPESFMSRCMDAIAEDPNRYYQRFKAVRLQEERQEAQYDRWHTAGAIRDARRLKVFPRNSDACMQWSRECDYLRLCNREASVDDPFLFRKAERTHEELDESDLELLTQSSLKTYRACPRRYFYRYEERVRPVSESAKPLLQGKSLHAALETWWKTGCDLQAAVASLLSEDPMDRAKEQAMVTGYHARWEDEQKKIQVVSIELELKTPLVNPETGAASRTFMLAGRLDGIVQA